MPAATSTVSVALQSAKQENSCAQLLLKICRDVTGAPPKPLTMIEPLPVEILIFEHSGSLLPPQFVLTVICTILDSTIY